MNALRWRGRQFRFPLVAAQRFRHESSFASQSVDVTPETQESTVSSLHERTKEVYRILRNGEPRQILTTLADPINYDVVASLPDSVFVSALLRLTPEYFIEPFLDTLRHVREETVLARGIRPIRDILQDFLPSMNRFISAWCSGGNKLGLVEYKHLLRISSSLGNLTSVSNIWRRMKREGVEPDLQCYNFLLHAMVWYHSVYGPERYHLRVTPYYLQKRNYGEQRGFRGFGTGARSVLKDVNAVASEMQNAGLAFDEDVYINLFLAGARVGSQQKMNSILKEIWMVDVEAIATKSDEIGSARPLVESSPLYPTRKLLWAVAHAYGCNNSFNWAVLTVEYISNQYGIEVTDDIWAELFERAFVLSRNRNGEWGRAFRRGKIHPEILFSLKKKLEPHGILFDMNMYRVLAKTRCVHQRYRCFQNVMEEAYELLRKTRRERDHALRVLENYLGMSLKIHSLSPLVKASHIQKNCKEPHVWRALQKYEILRSLVDQQRIILEKLVWVAVHKDRWTTPTDLDWTHRGFPRFIAEWKDFIPECFRIRLPTTQSEIEFVGRTSIDHANFRVHDNEPVRWSGCGEFLAIKDEQIQVSHDVLWARAKAHLGELADLPPLHWILNKRLDLESNHRLAALAAGVSEEFEEKLSPHAWYVTMVPLFSIPL
ncbi:conserved hypothetical protein [Talaromyces stipitatus ATCC 10500]|uniref:ATPase expression protein 2, mitochondrial n=1 Tax=Talaromyces stipitatus (strain ATCC 10500 / CBS 375.48 / QM 6759 / NRRL 1006) TaxID=441959 RepID=B8M336_TALSN|nr:uncharacterized protein TSTA_092570 [Talaromyces stipitatus ATCC 10500]EED22012.1 conserved hypothetical protein [Talaromyces stipitatus ATCC 10500]